MRLVDAFVGSFGRSDFLHPLDRLIVDGMFLATYAFISITRFFLKDFCPGVINPVHRDFRDLRLAADIVRSTARCEKERPFPCDE